VQRERIDPPLVAPRKFREGFNVRGLGPCDKFWFGVRHRQFVLKSTRFLGYQSNRHEVYDLVGVAAKYFQ
jgi:hypothetical protein